MDHNDYSIIAPCPLVLNTRTGKLHNRDCHYVWRMNPENIFRCWNFAQAKAKMEEISKHRACQWCQCCTPVGQELPWAA